MNSYKVNCAVVLSVLSLCVFADCTIATANETWNENEYVEEINRRINARGLEWTAGKNEMTRLPPWERKKYLMQTHPLQPKPDENRSHLISGDDLPEMFDWRSSDGENWMTSVKTQGKCGSCVAFAVCASLEATAKIQTGDPEIRFDLSEQMLFSCGGGLCDWGWTEYEAFSYLQNTGVVDEECLPYRAVDYNCEIRCMDWMDRVTRIGGWSQIFQPDNEELKAAIFVRPVVAVMKVYGDFNAYEEGIYEHVTGDYEGGHAICLLGWNDEEQYWIGKNSWGSNWGESGYFRIRWGEASINSFQSSAADNVIFPGIPPTPTPSDADYETIISEDITADTTWDSAGSPYHVKTFVSVRDGAALRIDAGVTVFFAELGRITVDDALIIARGNPEKPIIFTSLKQPGVPSSWFGLAFKDGAEDAVLDGIEYLSGSILEHCVIECSRTGIRIEQSDPFLKNCLFRECGYSALDCRGASPVVFNCRFSNNSSTGCGGAVQARYDADPLFVNCAFSHNEAANSGACVYLDESDAWFENCVFARNCSKEGPAIYAKGEGTHQVRHCTFYKNACEYDAACIVNAESDFSVVNSIFWKTGRASENCAVSFSCTTETGWGNFFANPIFKDANASHDFHLQSDSPCINSGTNERMFDFDIDMEPRPDGINPPDVGADEFYPAQSPTVTPTPTGIKHTSTPHTQTATRTPAPTRTATPAQTLTQTPTQTRTNPSPSPACTETPVPSPTITLTMPPTVTPAPGNPTIRIRTTRSTYFTGEIMPVYVDLTNPGTERSLEVYIAVEHNREFFFWPDFRTEPYPHNVAIPENFNLHDFEILRVNTYGLSGYALCFHAALTEQSTMEIISHSSCAVSISLIARK